ncbi:alpha/beta fold hydrolase [Corallococcus sp. bb12-1]|uniref:alpha/beta fold hydrolase n=1 Tax=Corallococcus sp. bb12-1 TaxID=2996784 RepID=UPI00226D943C|nr:alpha/beta fold hydrolase [Corallococcus sp. bb12-1]MCY1041578.1 alpha/beta fold hydrolase [Corallococcus sp. bb12-1]
MMSRFQRSLWILATLALTPSACVKAPPSHQGPHSSDELPSFYQPPSPLPTEPAGYVIAHEKLTGPAALESAGSNERVLYLSNSGSVGEAPVAVSGIIALPDGPAPTGGWPIVTWAHGTLGIADKCAPSRDAIGASAHYFNQAPHRLLNQFLKKGWAVVMTDYEGLGTPGRHPYVLGNSEAYGTLDIVRAAKKLHGNKLSTKFAIVGHSQGGQAALFAAARAPTRLTQEEGLELVGVIAYAPASAMRLLFHAGAGREEKSPDSAFMPLFLTGAVEGNPSKVKLTDFLSEDAVKLYERVDTECRVELSEETSWGGIVPKDFVMKESPVFTELNAQLEAMDPSTLQITVPVRLVQGAQDERVNPAQTVLVKLGLARQGATIDYVGCPVADHFGVLGDDIPGTLAWLKQQFTGDAPTTPVLSSCQPLP